MVRQEIETAHELRKEGKLAIFPVRLGFQGKLPYDLGGYLNHLQYALTWYVLAALGIYHAAPGSQAWELASPAFAHAVVSTGHGRALTIDAPGASNVNRYVQSATLNGKPFARTWLPAQALHDGARLHFTLGPLPNQTWATDPSAAPPSLTP